MINLGRENVASKALIARRREKQFGSFINLGREYVVSKALLHEEEKYINYFLKNIEKMEITVVSTRQQVLYFL